MVRLGRGRWRTRGDSIWQGGAVWALNKQLISRERREGFQRVCAWDKLHVQWSDACGKHTSPPLLRLSPPRPLYTCYLSFHCQVAEDSFRPSENGGWAFWGGSCFIFTSNLHRFGILFLSSLFLPPEFIPWQHASGLVGAPMHPPVLLLVKTQREAPYQFPGRRRVVAPRACTESLIDATRNQHAPLIKSTA